MDEIYEICYYRHNLLYCDDFRGNRNMNFYLLIFLFISISKLTTIWNRGNRNGAEYINFHIKNVI